MNTHQAQMTVIDTVMSMLPQMDVVLKAAPERTAVIVVDMVKGFCTDGPLASPRVQGLAAPIAAFLQAQYERGVRAFFLAQDTHPPEAKEFASFAPHCVAGTVESETIPEIAALSFETRVVEKNTLDMFLGNERIADELLAWYDAVILVGDCTDLCVFHNAMHLKMLANQRGLDLQVVVPANLVQTYDLPAEIAVEIGACAHEGDFFHKVFLYQMLLNGIAVCNA